MKNRRSLKYGIIKNRRQHDAGTTSCGKPVILADCLETGMNHFIAVRQTAQFASPAMEIPKTLLSYPRYRPELKPAHFLPMTRKEMKALGWDACDVVLVTGDAYIDHPSFGMALFGRLLEAQGFRVGIISQPDWHSAEPFLALGKPNLYFGITAGNMDSKINRYTSDRKIRPEDAYTADGE